MICMAEELFHARSHLRYHWDVKMHEGSVDLNFCICLLPHLTRSSSLRALSILQETSRQSPLANARLYVTLTQHDLQTANTNPYKTPDSIRKRCSKGMSMSECQCRAIPCLHALLLRLQPFLDLRSGSCHSFGKLHASDHRPLG